MVPKAFDIRDGKRAREENERLAEQRDGSRKASSTTVGSGGKLDIDGGDLTVKNGGSAVVKDGGLLRIEQGGGAEITGDGEINVIGEGRNWYTKDPITVSSCLANRLADNSWIGYQYLQPGLYFNAGESQGANDPRVTSEDGVGLNLVSAVLPLQYGPQVGTNMATQANLRVSPEFASIGTGAWDDAVNPGGGNGLAGRKGSAYSYFTPASMGMQLINEGLGTPATPAGMAASVTADLTEGKLQLAGRNGVNVQGPFTVNGSPIGGGAVSSVNTKTGDVVLNKSDIGLSNVNNTTDLSKPISTDTQTALDNKAGTAVATPSTNGLMSSTDKVSLNGILPGSWVSIPPATGWQAQAGETPQAKIINGVVYMTGNFQYIGAATSVGGFYSTSQLLGQLPAGYYPPKTITLTALATWHSSGSTTICRITVGTTGELRMYAMATNGVTTNFQIGSATYFFMSSVAAYPLP